MNLSTKPGPTGQKIANFLGPLLVIWLVFVVWKGIATPNTVAEDSQFAQLRLISSGQDAVERTLKDPQSVQWNRKAINKENGALCYAYSAKNSWGGYVPTYSVIVDGVLKSGQKTYWKHCPTEGIYENF